MDTLTYTLSLSRLARVQCVTWGHPVTTGSREMDYFISSQTLETDDAQDHYTEQLIRFRNVNSFYYRPPPASPKGPESFGLDPERNIYLCFQNLFKIHPEFDEILAGILDRDPNGDIVMMQGAHEPWTGQLTRRLERTAGSAISRVKFLPGLSHPDFLSLNQASTVSLDPLHFGGGNTSYEALATGLPIVTLPSRYLRGRITSAMYRQMGMSDCIVEDKRQYIDLAVKIGTDREYRNHVSARIMESCPVLFEDRSVIEDYSRFFESLA